jgi:RNA polymerase-binding transcription factor DksA
MAQKSKSAPKTSKTKSAAKATKAQTAPRRRKPAAETVSTEEALRRRAAQVDSIVEFIDRTSLGGDEEAVTGELTTSDQHPADTSDITFQRELDLTVREMAEAHRAQMEEALQRQREGTYGICEECGQPIDPERLRARPESLLCIDCQRRQESHLRS